MRARVPSYIAIALLLLLATAGVTRAQVPPVPGIPPATYPPRLVTPDDRINRLQLWFALADRHEAGVDDEAVEIAAGWNVPELQGLWIDAFYLAMRLRDPEPTDYRLTANMRDRPANSRNTRIVYTLLQQTQLTALACAAGGNLTSRPSTAIEGVCAQQRAATVLPPSLSEAARRYRLARDTRKDDNLWLWRAAILHSDVAMLRASQTTLNITPPLPVGPRRIQVRITDGRISGYGLTGLHWEIASMLLDHIQPRGTHRPSPAEEPAVRDWYHATAAWMHGHEQYDAIHLERGRQLFRDDPGLLFLSGCLYEAFASPMMRPALALALSGEGTNASFNPGLRGYWERAEDYFVRAFARDATLGEALLHRGRVLALLGHYDDSATLLRAALATLRNDRPLVYYAQLFLGDAEEGQRHFAEARRAYETAQTLFPEAQKPQLALSQLAWRQDSHQGARAAIQSLFAQSARERDTLGDLTSGGHEAAEQASSDPWSSYFTSHARHADAMISTLWQQVLQVTP